MFFFFVRMYEVVRGHRFFERGRAKLDNGVLSVIHTGRHARLFLTRELAVKILHAFAFSALVSVRFLERKLEDMTIFLRSFRRKARAKRLEEKKRKEMEG